MPESQRQGWEREYQKERLLEASGPVKQVPQGLLLASFYIHQRLCGMSGILYFSRIFFLETVAHPHISCGSNWLPLRNPALPPQGGHVILLQPIIA